MGSVYVFYNKYTTETQNAFSIRTYTIHILSHSVTSVRIWFRVGTHLDIENIFRFSGYKIFLYLISFGCHSNKYRHNTLHCTCTQTHTHTVYIPWQKLIRSLVVYCIFFYICFSLEKHIAHETLIYIQRASFIVVVGVIIIINWIEWERQHNQKEEPTTTTKKKTELNR